MRFQGNVIENLKGAAQSRDKILIRAILIDEIANIIESKPKEMIKTLRYSNVKVKDTASMKNLIDLASYNLHNNPIFQKNLAVTITMRGSAKPHDYANQDGGGAAAGGGDGGGGGAGGWVTSIADMIGSIGKYGASSNELKAEEEKTKGKMYEKIFGGQQKTNWLPIIALAGVLLIGGIVVWRVTGAKK